MPVRIQDDDLSKATKAALAKILGEGELSEADLIKGLTSGITTLGKDVKLDTVDDLRSLIGEIAERASKHADMEKGFNAYGQRLGALEKNLRDMGIDPETVLTGKPGGKPKDRKTRLRELIVDKHKMDPKHLDFWDDILGLAEPETKLSEEMMKPLVMAMALATTVAQSHWESQFRSDPAYKDVPPEVMEDLFKSISEDQNSLGEFMKTRKNPLQAAYTKYFAEKHPELVRQKMDQKTKEQQEKEHGLSSDKPIFDLPPNQKSGPLTSTQEMNDSLKKAGFNPD